MPLWRGDLSPLGCAAVLKAKQLGVSDRLSWLYGGLLRSLAGINPLATGFTEQPLFQNGTATLTWLYTLVPLPVT
ncbi:hypothetical protein GKKCFE_14165 [Pseudomonas sp. E141]|jgi:hypothetical protein